jgi:hypothetical protein
MTKKSTKLQLFDQMLTKHVLPEYSQMKYGKITYLFAHIHAMRSCKIITEQDIIFNFTKFCRHLREILNDNKLSQSKCYDRHNFPSQKQEDLSINLIHLYSQNI